MGLSTERIETYGTTPVKHVTCSICKDILWKPQTCNTCKNAFCKECLDYWFNRHHNTCPMMHHYKNDRVPPLLNDMLSELRIFCYNKTNGCTDVLSYDALEQHELKGCNYQKVNCHGCKIPMLKKDLDQHESECDQIEINCDLCETKYRRKDVHEEAQCLQNAVVLHDKIMKQSQQNGLATTTAANSELPLGKSRKIIQFFDDIPINGAAVIPEGEASDGYYSLKWSHLTLVSRAQAESWDQENPSYHYQNAFLDGSAVGQAFIAQNTSTWEPMSITMNNNSRTFTVESFTACTPRTSDLQVKIRGWRNGEKKYKMTVILTPSLAQVPLEMEDIDKITFDIMSFSSKKCFAMSEIIIIA
ncbi:unnamed protein product [Didymodactylos carnosus]|uniref:RING-type domain-containing protein n=1 Tax=Didymodactylos carnosus TaxID=1234261 RepID=A0A813V3I4_9BILA|nr:unnamed protein product [Didymodactylos carnosus]CAF0766797.1 unnamed protein product [Didymodactylos carnosus]CAF0837689.1 unnamed protein product [Didymodactylos carnosus]CAF3547152.1 unnamed protein product [Didymodactylos carnosus]CAF3547208.1 unnamed protein product [Didymodactylos carnosus]